MLTEAVPTWSVAWAATSAVATVTLSPCAAGSIYTSKTKVASLLIGGGGMDGGASQVNEATLALFLQITGADLAQGRNILEAANWQLESAVNLFYINAADGGGPTAGVATSTTSSEPQTVPTSREEFVRAPIPAKREVLYQEEYLAPSFRASASAPQVTVDAFRDFRAEQNGAASADGSAEAKGLAALFKPPTEILFAGNFEQAKAKAVELDRWLLVNIQSVNEFASHLLNRDTWSHSALKNIISSSFVFWQRDQSSEEGAKLSTFYRITNTPVTMVVDPVTGRKLRMWEGVVEPERLLEDMVQYLDHGPMKNPKRFKDGSIPPPRVQATTTASTPALASSSKALSEDEELALALAASMEGASGSAPAPIAESPPSVDPEELRRQQAAALGEEPSASDANACTIAVRLPDGQRVRRRFLKARPLQELGTYCRSLTADAAAGRAFRLAPSVPGLAPLDLNSNQSLDVAGVAGSMLVMSWA
eukprot:jgi/Chlat1/8245/Chrsp77S07683